MYAQSTYGRTLPSPGVGLRGPHVQEVLNRLPEIGWLEVHPENYMNDPTALALLERARAHYPVSLHGVSLSLGSAERIDLRQLARLELLVDRLEPFLVSDHLSWSAIGGAHLNDLLPLPCTDEALDVMANHVDQVQCAIGRTILIENPSTYLRYRHSTMTEAEFLAALAWRTGCGVLLDVNNLHVSAHNVGLSIADYFRVLPGSAVGEIHLAGHAVNHVGEQTMLIDDHGSPVADAVWALYASTLEHYGYRPTLVEWDSNLPPLDVLVAEAQRARELSRSCPGGRRADAA
jgi:uncharacterized protein (UPF0276 family)